MRTIDMDNYMEHGIPPNSPSSKRNGPTLIDPRHSKAEEVPSAWIDEIPEVSGADLKTDSTELKLKGSSPEPENNSSPEMDTATDPALLTGKSPMSLIGKIW
jgi:hypothetical protein